MLHVVSWLLFVAAFVAAAWPLPLWFLRDPWHERYQTMLDSILGAALGGDVPIDPTARGALPFVWAFFTLPLSVVLWFAGLCCRWLGESA
jgi:hypothetical protein